jgi:hypothetical protein
VSNHIVAIPPYFCFQFLPHKHRGRVSNPITGLDRPLGFQEVEAHRFLDNRHMKVVRLSALRTGRLYPPGNTPCIHVCSRLSRPQGHSATERIMSMKNSNDTIGNRTRDLPACRAVPQPTAPPAVELIKLLRNGRLQLGIVCCGRYCVMCSNLVAPRDMAVKPQVA